MSYAKQLRCLIFATSCLFMLAMAGCEPKVDLGSESKAAVTREPVVKRSAPATKISDEAFRFAAHDGRLETVRAAIEAGKDVNAGDPNTAHTAMHMAAYNGHTAIVKLLLEHGATVDCRDAEGKTPLTHACTGSFPETVEILLAAGADINAAEATEGFTPLMMAAGLGETEVVKVLLSHGADATIQDADKDTALSHAKNSGHGKIVALLDK